MENRNCKHGEVHVITKEIWCKAANEFCKFIQGCKENPIE